MSGKGEIFFLRHAETKNAQKGLIKGQLDYPLSKQGQKQAKLTGLWFQDNPLELIISSPLKRARQTAETIYNSLLAKRKKACEFRIIPELTEIATGIFTGLTLSQASEKYPQIYSNFNKQSWDGVPSAEKSGSLLKRALQVWQILSKSSQDGKNHILVVSHKGFFQGIFKTSLQTSGWMPLLDIDYCGIYRLSYENTPHKFYAIWDIFNFAAWK